MNGTIDYTALDNESLIKLDTSPRGNVQFKPPKKMKKRRQLDALVSNGKNSKKVPRRKQNGHELLRSNDSESSEVDEFNVLESQKWSKRWSTPSCCSTCYTLTCILVVTTCLLASAALIWMHLELKRDFKELRDRMDLVENKNAGTPEELQNLQTKLQTVNKSVTDVKSGKNGLEALSLSIVNIQTQIATLTASQLQQNTLSGQSNDKETKAVASTVADLGSGLQTTNKEVESLKADQNQLKTQLTELANRLSLLEKPNGREGGSSVPISYDYMDQIASVNATLLQHIEQATTDLGKLEAHKDTLDQYTKELQDQINSLTTQAANLTQTQQRLQNMIATLQQLQLSSDRNQSAVFDEKSISQPTGDVDIISLKKDHQDFVGFKADVFQDFNSLNASLASLNYSVVTLNKDVADLFENVVGAVRNVTELTTVVDYLTQVVESLKMSHKSELVTPVPKSSGLTPAEAENGTEDKQAPPLV